jgi:protein involved in polysaccharide export with SLBB domain
MALACLINPTNTPRISDFMLIPRRAWRLRLAGTLLGIAAAISPICILLPTPAMVAQQSPAAFPPPSREPYVLKAGDDLEITFFYNPELNQHAPIRPDGRISMPLLGELQAEGLTVQKLTDVLTAAYETQLRKTSLNIQVRSSPSQVIFVGGEVEHPGVFALQGTAPSALQAVVEAGGMKESASHGGVVVLRKGAQGTIEMHRLSFKTHNGETESASFQLQPLDVLIVSESRISKIDRVMDQYVKRLSPILMTGGFTYLFGNATTGAF